MGIRIVVVLGVFAGFAIGVGSCARPSARSPSLPIDTGGPSARDVDATKVATEISFECGSRTYTLTTGAEHGTCRTQTDAAGTTTGGKCGDDVGNSAEATCGANNGEGRCVGTSGAGGCSYRESARTNRGRLDRIDP
jgi:hypothetical protein